MKPALVILLIKLGLIQSGFSSSKLPAITNLIFFKSFEAEMKSNIPFEMRSLPANNTIGG